MKFTLNSYQTDAVMNLLLQLREARALYRHPTNPRETSLALTAPTGAGKTVMAAATIEALLFGSDHFSFQPDPTAVVIWFSDNPNLNEQSRFRLMQASERLTSAQLVVIKPPFSLQALESGRVYFVNTARFSKNSLLTRGYVPNEDGSEVDLFSENFAPDDLAWNIWQTIANTIEDENKTLYFVLDEAHRGFDKSKNNERQTIVRRLVSGDETGLPMPVVLGISATSGRFRAAMGELDKRNERLALPDVDVDPARVVESGLIKDAVKLEIPDEGGDLSTALVREAAKKLQQSTFRWKKYCRSEGMAEPVVPLLVVQIPNVQDNDLVGQALDAIVQEVPDIDSSSVRHVLGDNKTEKFGSWTIDWIEPQRVQETPKVRVLIAKEAISTGWDCPRAEVLLSFRPAKDQTHIAQLLGRMVRNPLARRIPGDDNLNAVECILPYFDKTTAGSVVRYITGKIEDLPGIGISRVLIDPRELGKNPKIDDAVWAAFDALPTQSVPQRGVKPVKRLVSLAQALSADGVRKGALAEVQTKVQELLDEASKTHSAALKAAEKEVHDVHLQILTGGASQDGITYSTRIVRADHGAIRNAFEEAKRVFGADIAQGYVNYLADLEGAPFELIEAFVRTSALATVREVQEQVDRLTDEIAAKWFEEHKSEIAALTDERQQEYETIRSLATEPQTGVMRQPKNKLEDFSVAEGETISAAPLVELHLMSDENGMYPVGSLNGWEQKVVALEIKRPSCVGWYRNPSHNGMDSVTVAYKDSVGDWRSMHPDFIFFEKVSGEILPSIVDPHGQHLDDSLVKLQGLAKYAERYGDDFHRIEAVVQDGNSWRKLDLKKGSVRELILNHTGPVNSLYGDPESEKYE